MNEQVKRYWVHPREMDDSEERWKSEDERVVLASDYDRDIKALEAQYTDVDTALTAVCEERDQYHEDCEARDETITRLREDLANQYDAYMDALKSEHDTLVNTGHLKTATGTTRAMMILGEIHDAALTEGEK